MAEGLIFLLQRDSKGRFINGEPQPLNRKNWIGERYGILTVIDAEFGVKKHPDDKRAYTMLTLKCDCGNIIKASTHNIKSRVSCGCLNKNKQPKLNLRKDLTGQRFGRVVIQEMFYGRPTKCRCICDCGKEFVARATTFTSGGTTSCGCLRSERTTEAVVVDYTGMKTKLGVTFIRRTNEKKHGGYIWECECPICHEHFFDTPHNQFNHGRPSCGCLSERSSISFPEKTIMSFLDEKNVRYIHDYSIPGCEYKKPLRFDFAIFNDNEDLIHIIEYDGRQHFEPSDLFGGEEVFELGKIRDKVKDDFCKENNIPLTRLPYTMSYDEIKDTIENIINP